MINPLLAAIWQKHIMDRGLRTERRQAKGVALLLEPSFLLHLAPNIAWPTLILATCALITAEYILSPDIWFGPAYLAVITFAAWSLSCRIAIGLGVLILSSKMMAIGLGVHPNGSEFEILNNILKFLAISFVVGLIGVARKSCEKEWHLARIDSLTGALNRQAFFEAIERDNSSKGWSALIYADLNGLKRLNDEAGHAQGDKSLTLFSERVRNTIRDGDVFARLGGDEFVIFMKIEDEQSGKVVASRLDRSINEKNANEPSWLACSFGILLLPDGSTSIDSELKAADELMYQAKKRQTRALVATAIENAGKFSFSTPLLVTDAKGRELLVGSIDQDSISAAEPQEFASRSAA